MLTGSDDIAAGCDIWQCSMPGAILIMALAILLSSMTMQSQGAVPKLQQASEGLRKASS